MTDPAGDRAVPEDNRPDAAPDHAPAPSTSPSASTAEEEDWIGESNFADAPPAAQSRRFPEQGEPSGALVMVETAFLSSAASLIWLVNTYFPMGPVLRIFFPVPIALVYLRWGSRAGWMAALVSGLLLTVLMGPTRSILYVMPFGLMGVLLGSLWRRGVGWGPSIGLGTLLGAIGTFFRLWLASLLTSEDLWLYATTQIRELLEWACLRLGLLVQPSLSVVQAFLVVMIVVNNLVYLFVVHLAAWFLLERLGNHIPRPPRWVEVLLDEG